MSLYTVTNGSGMAAQDVNQVVNLLTGADPVTSMSVPGRVSSTFYGLPYTAAYAGATTGGPPTSGTFQAGDFVIDQTGFIHTCVAGGSPGTWYRQGCGTHACILTNTGAQTLTARSSRTSWDVCTVNTAGYDPHSMFVAGSHEIQVPLPGYYLVHGTVQTTLASTTFSQAAVLLHNGAEAARGDEYQVVNGGACKAFDVVSCAANDTIQLACYAEAAAVTATNGAVRLSAVLIA